MPVLPGGDGGTKAYYNVILSSVRCGNSKNSNTPQIELVFSHEEQPEYGITAYRYLTAKTLEYVCKDLKVLGWDPVEHAYRFEELDGGEQSPIAGAKATICVQDEEYEGKWRPKVLFINPYGQQGGGEPRERMEPAAAKSWGDRVRQALGIGAPSGPAPARPGSATRAKPAPTGPGSRTDRVRDATRASMGGAEPPASPRRPETAAAAQGEDYDFEDIPF